MVDAAHSAMNSNSVTLMQSRTSWGIEFGRHRISLTRMREARAVGRLDDASSGRSIPKLIGPIVIGTFASVSAFGLTVIGAGASEPSPFQGSPHYAVSVPVPTRATKRPVRLPDRPSLKSRQASAETGTPPRSGEILSGARFDAEDEPHVAQAMQAGEFQEWLGADGQRRFLNAGPMQAETGKRCRDLVLLVRRMDGSSHTRSARRCTSGHTRGGGIDAPAPETAFAQERRDDPSTETRVPEWVASAASAHTADLSSDPISQR